MSTHIKYFQGGIRKNIQYILLLPAATYSYLPDQGLLCGQGYYLIMNRKCLDQTLQRDLCKCKIASFPLINVVNIYFNPCPAE